MKVEKITIKKELMEIEDDKPYEEIIVDGLDQIITEGEIKDFKTTAVRVPYSVRHYVDKDMVVKSFLVRVNDDKLFNELLETNKSDIDTFVYNRVMAETENIRKEEIFIKNKIKALSFYKRLFNKF